MSLSFLFDGLKSEPHGLVPYSNLTGKGHVSLKNTKKLGSYNWLNQEKLEGPTIIIPGEPRQQQAFGGCKMSPDTEGLIFDPNHIGLPAAPMDPIFQTLKHLNTKDVETESLNFQQYDIVTDVINLQKLFAFCRGDSDGGLFRIDLERVGKLLLFNRCEGADFIPVDEDYPCFDVNLKNLCSRARSSVTGGPFCQLSEYELGAFKLLVRYQAELAEFSEADWQVETEELNEDFTKNAKAFEGGPLRYLEYGKTKKCNLTMVSAIPEGKGFPHYLWPALYFSGAEKMLVGWYKGTGEFQKPASYSLSEMNRLVKPLPYPTVTRLHDLLAKIINFMRNSEEDAKVTIVWQGFPHLELYERAAQHPGGISKRVRQYLKSQRPGEGIPEEPEEDDEDNLEDPPEADSNNAIDTMNGQEASNDLEQAVEANSELEVQNDGQDSIPDDTELPVESVTAELEVHNANEESTTANDLEPEVQSNVETEAQSHVDAETKIDPSMNVHEET